MENHIISLTWVICKPYYRKLNRLYANYFHLNNKNKWNYRPRSSSMNDKGIKSILHILISLILCGSWYCLYEKIIVSQWVCGTDFGFDFPILPHLYDDSGYPHLFFIWSTAVSFFIGDTMMSFGLLLVCIHRVSMKTFQIFKN